jgi:hypothetical protein
MHSAAGANAHTLAGCPIRIRTALRLTAAPRPRFAARRVLLRPLAPRHPPHTLLSLAYCSRQARDILPLWMCSKTWLNSALLRCLDKPWNSTLSSKSAKLKETPDDRSSRLDHQYVCITMKLFTYAQPHIPVLAGWGICASNSRLRSTGRRLCKYSLFESAS